MLDWAAKSKITVFLTDFVGMNEHSEASDRYSSVDGVDIMTRWVSEWVEQSGEFRKQPVIRKKQRLCHNNGNTALHNKLPGVNQTDCTFNYLCFVQMYACSVFVTFVSLVAFLPPDQHGVITTEEEQYLIEPLKNISSTTSSEWNLDEAQQHVIYKMSAIPSPQEHSQEFSCGISGWWTSIWVWTLCGWNWRKGITIHSRLEEVLVWLQAQVLVRHDRASCVL